MDFHVIGNYIVKIMLGIAYFVITICVLKDVLSCIAKKDVEGIVKAVVSGIIGYYVTLNIPGILSKVGELIK